jgi:hypothetical protein
METVSAVSGESDTKSRKYLSLTLQQLASVGGRAAAAAIGVHESTVSRMKDGELERYCRLVEALGLKIVSQEMKCYRPADIDPYIQLAKRHMEQVNSAEQLVWED